MPYNTPTMNSYIEIGPFVFRDRIAGVSIKSSWKNLSDTAVITLPNLVRLTDNTRPETLLKVGDKVLIRLGYNNQLNDEFIGYISRIKPAIPFVIECEDEMWKLKQTTVSMSWPSIKLADLIKYLVPTADVTCPDITLSPFRLDKVSIAKALQKLKEEYMLTSYFRAGKLYVGLPYFETLPTVAYNFQGNVPKDGLAGLEYKRSDDVRLKVKAIGMLPNNTRDEVEVGDEGGDTTTLHFYNKSGNELKALAAQKLGEMKFDGYRGSFTAFGVPMPIHGMIAKVTDSRYPERSGSFFIDSVNVEFNSSGFRRQIELGKKATS
jgi:hypothetical protein